MTIEQLIANLEKVREKVGSDSTVLIAAGGSCYEPWIALDVCDMGTGSPIALVLSDVKPGVVLPE